MLKWLSNWFISSRMDWGAFASEERGKRLTIAGGNRRNPKRIIGVRFK
jgi:hypothetical protein